MSWNPRKSAELYGIDYWGAPYFRINEGGNIEVRPDLTSKRLDVFRLVKDLVDRSLRLPILVRFPDLIRARIELLQSCFDNSISEYEYKGNYMGVFPIKVNQQRHVVEEIAKHGESSRLGLECGSKPELLVACAVLETSEALIICNGFKDREYIETALLSQKLGRNTILVVDRRQEVEEIIKASERLNIKPRIGFRVKLSTQSSGKWVESSGNKSKFGLTPSEIVSAVEVLKQHDLMSSLEMIHFHIGSQIPSIQSIKSAVKEATHFYTELFKMGAPIQFVDVGGGLGVDYDGSGKGDSSTNYSEQEYANDVVSIIQSICDEKSIPHPNIISESGRSIIAHSSILVFDVLGVNQVAKRELNCAISESDSRIVQDLKDIFDDLNETNFNEYYNDLVEKKRDTQQMFSYGVLSLEQRAKAEDLYWAIATKMHELTRNHPDGEDIYWALEKEQTDTFFCNFSVFQSLPDSWAVGQRFPVMPLHRLDEMPERRGILVDLTCDSDGKMDSFNDFDSDEPQNYIEVHDLKPGEPYYMGVFLTGAYQETLGDLHNLFGDTDAVHVSLLEDGKYTVDKVVKGDSINEVLSYVQYEPQELIERIRRTSEHSIAQGQLSLQEAGLLMDHYTAGLSGYTYLSQT